MGVMENIKIVERHFIPNYGSAKAHHIIKLEGLFDGDTVCSTPLLIVTTSEVRVFYEWFKNLKNEQIFVNNY